MRILGILIIYVTLISGQQIQQIRTNTGLYYEPLKGLRFTKTEWKLVTAIDIRSILTNHPELEIGKMNELISNCKLHLRDSLCESHLPENYIKIMFNKIETYHQQIKQMTYPDVSGTRINRNVPFGFIGTLSKTLFGTLNEEDVANFNQEIDKLYENQSSLSKLLANQTHIVQSDLHNIHQKVNNMHNKLDKTYTVLLRLQKDYEKSKTEANRSVYQKLIEAMGTYLHFSLEGYLSNLKSVVSAINFARMGQLHPELIGPSTLTKAAKDFVQHERHMELPVPINEIYSGELSKIAKISINYYDEKLILVMHIPLLEPTRYLLYKLHSYPTLQIFGNNSLGSAYIHPRANYLIISEEHDKYSMIHEHELPHCYSLLRTFVCIPSHPLYLTTMQPTCEVSLLTNNQFDPHKNCDIRVSKTFKPYWKHLTDTQVWLFSLPREENLYINCNNNSSTASLISGSGILKLQSNCLARNAYAIMMGYDTIETEINLKHLPTFELNVTQLLPEIQTYEPLSPLQKEGETSHILTDASVPEPLNYDSSLNDIEQKLLEISTHTRKENKQNIIMYNIGGVTILLIIGFLLILYKQFISRLCCKVCTKSKGIDLKQIRKIDLEKGDQLTEEELEQFSTYNRYSRPDKEIIYETPIILKKVPSPKLEFSGPELKETTSRNIEQQTTNSIQGSLTSL